MSTEDIYIKNIEAAIRGVRMRTKTPQDVAASLSVNMEKLKKVNEGMATDLMNNYKAVVADYNKSK